MFLHGLSGHACVLAVCALVAPVLGCVPTQDSRSCADLQTTVRAVQELFALDWSSLDDEAIRSVWPLARDLKSFCDDCSTTEGGRIVLSCCRDCEVCPSIHFEVPGDARTPLRSISVAMCSASFDSTARDLNTLVEAIEPEGDVLYEAVRDHSRSIAFVKGGERYQRAIHSTLLEHDGQWIANVTLLQCASKGVVLEVAGENGQTIVVTDIRIETSSPGESRMMVEYSTNCYALDRRCVEAEARTLWPEVRDRAEDAVVSEVSLWAEGCGVHTSVPYRKDDNGEWAGHYAFKP